MDKLNTQKLIGELEQASQTMEKVIVDLQRPVEGDLAQFLAEKAKSDCSFYAMTPYAAWVLGSLRIEFKTLNDVYSCETYHREGVENYRRIETVLQKTHSNLQRLFPGLVYDLKIALDYLSQENRKLEYFAHSVGTVVTDRNPTVQPSSLKDFRLNRLSLYQQNVENFKITFFERKRLLRMKIMRRFAKYRNMSPVRTAVTLSRALFRRTRDGKKVNLDRKPVILSDFRYDWAHAKPFVERDFFAMPFNEIKAMIHHKSLSLEEQDEVRKISSAFAANLKEEFREIALPIQEAAFPILISHFTQFATFARKAIAAIPSMRQSMSIRGVLHTFCWDEPEEFIVSSLLKEEGVNTLFYQHGGVINRALCIQYNEVIPASINFVFGDQDRLHLESMKCAQQIVVAGSATLDGLRKAPRKDDRSAFYLLDTSPGNGNCVDSRWHWPEPDGINLFLRHKAVIDLFGSHPDWKLVVRPHPWHFTHALYEPIAEHISECGYHNITIDMSTAGADDFFEHCTWQILDYVSTGILQASAKGLENIICFTGRPYLVPDDVLHLVENSFYTANSLEQFIHTLQSVIFEGKTRSFKPEDRQAFEKAFGRRLPEDSKQIMEGVIRQALSPA